MRLRLWVSRSRRFEGSWYHHQRSNSRLFFLGLFDPDNKGTVVYRNVAHFYIQQRSFTAQNIRISSNGTANTPYLAQGFNSLRLGERGRRGERWIDCTVQLIAQSGEKENTAVLVATETWRRLSVLGAVLEQGVRDEQGLGHRTIGFAVLHIYPEMKPYQVSTLGPAACSYTGCFPNRLCEHGSYIAPKSHIHRHIPQHLRCSGQW